MRGNMKNIIKWPYLVHFCQPNMAIFSMECSVVPSICVLILPLRRFRCVQVAVEPVLFEPACSGCGR